MSDIINDLKHFEEIAKKNIFSNYENSKEFTSGSFDEHMLNIVNQSGSKPMNYSTTLKHLKESFAEPFDKRAVVAIDYDLLYRSSTSPIYTDNLYVTSAYIIGEVFEYAERNGTDVSALRVRFDEQLESLKKKMDDLDQYFIELDKISYLCTKFAKVSRINEPKAIVLFDQIKKALENPDGMVNKITYNTDIGYMLDSKLITDISGLSTIKNEVIDKIKNDRTSNNVLTLADTYILNQDNLSTLQQSVLEKSTLSKVEFTASQKISGMMLFSDYSICYREQNGKYLTPVSHDEATGKIRELYKSTVDYLLRKKPQIAKSFKEKLMENESSAFTIINTIKRFLDNETLVKNHLKQDYDSFLRELMTNKSVEVFDDQYTKIAEKQKFQLFAYSIASNKYRHLYDDQSMVLLKEIYDNNQDTEQLQSYVGKKIAAFKTPEDFNSHLTRYLSKINGFDPEIILEDIKKYGATIVSNENNVLIAETTSYTQMNNLGSNSWCIVRDEGYYDDYATGNRQYIVYDFNKAASDVQSMIGVTLNKNGTYRNAHVKDDESIDVEDVEHFTDIMVMAQRKTFPNLDKDLEERLYPEVARKNKLKMA